MNAVLAILACLSDGTGCQPFVITDILPQAACLSASQIMAAKWAGEHPGYQIKRIVCMDPRQLSVLLGRTSA